MATLRATNPGAAPTGALPAPEPLIAGEGTAYISDAFNKARSPAEAIDIIQAHAGLRNPLCQPLLILLEHLGVTRREAHHYILQRARDMLVQWLRHLAAVKKERSGRRASDSGTPGSNTDQLERLLVSSFGYLTIPELADVPIAVMEAMDQVPAAQLKKLLEEEEVFTGLPLHLQQQVWEHHPTAFNKQAVAMLASYKYETATILELLSMNDSITKRPPPPPPPGPEGAAPAAAASGAPGPAAAVATAAAAGVGRLPPLPRPRSAGALPFKAPQGVLRVTALLPSAAPVVVAEAAGAASGGGAAAASLAERMQSPFRASPGRAPLPSSSSGGGGGSSGRPSPQRSHMGPPTTAAARPRPPPGRPSKRNMSASIQALAGLVKGNRRLWNMVAALIQDKVSEGLLYYGPKELSLCMLFSQLTLFLAAPPAHLKLGEPLVDPSDPTFTLARAMDIALARGRLDAAAAQQLAAWLAAQARAAQQAQEAADGGGDRDSGGRVEGGGAARSRKRLRRRGMHRGGGGDRGDSSGSSSSEDDWQAPPPKQQQVAPLRQQQRPARSIPRRQWHEEEEEEELEDTPPAPSGLPKLRLKAFKVPGAVPASAPQQQAAAPAAPAAARPAPGRRRNPNAMLADSDDDSSSSGGRGGGGGHMPPPRAAPPPSSAAVAAGRGRGAAAGAAGGGGRGGRRGPGGHAHPLQQQETLMVGPAGAGLGAAAMVLRDPAAMHLLAMEVVEQLHLCVQERRLPSQSPLLRLALQLMHIGVTAHPLCRKGAALTLPHPGRLHDLWPFVAGLLAEGALLAPEEAADASWEWGVAEAQPVGWRVLVHSVSVNEVTRKVLQMLVLEALSREALALASLLLGALVAGLDLRKWPAASYEYTPFAYSLGGQMEGLVKAGKVRVGDTLWHLVVERVMLAGVDADLMVHSETVRVLIAAAKQLTEAALGRYCDTLFASVRKAVEKKGAAVKRFGGISQAIQDAVHQADEAREAAQRTPYEAAGQTDWSDGYANVRSHKYGNVDSLSHLYKLLFAVGSVSLSSLPPYMQVFLGARDASRASGEDWEEEGGSEGEGRLMEEKEER